MKADDGSKTCAFTCGENPMDNELECDYPTISSFHVKYHEEMVSNPILSTFQLLLRGVSTYVCCFIITLLEHGSNKAYNFTN